MFFNAWTAAFARGARNEEAQGLVEYSLILFLVSLTGLILLTTVGSPIVKMFSDIADKIPT